MGKPRDLANVVATGNILADGAVAPAELTGVTSTAAEINILDGVTATAAELNLLDGVTATTAELNHVDGVTSNVQTQMDTKAPVASPTFTGTATAPTINASTALQIGGTAITATAAELNKMDGVTVSASDINSVTTKAPIDGATFTGTTTIPTADINGGAIDGAVIGANSAVAGTFTDVTATGTTTITTADINGGAIDGAVIGANSAAAVTATTVNASTKLQVNGTDVITNARQLSNIASVDSTTVAALSAAGVGGAGNAKDFVASGSITNGNVVKLNANGTVSVTSAAEFVSDSTFAYDNTNQWSTTEGVYDATTNQVIVGFRNPDDGGKPAYVVGSVSGDAITFGAYTRIENAVCYDVNIVLAHSGTLLIGYNYGGQYYKMGSYTIEAGALTKISEDNTQDTPSTVERICKLIWMPNRNAALVVYRTNSYLQGSVFTVNSSSYSVSYASNDYFVNNGQNITNVRTAFDTSQEVTNIIWYDSSNGNAYYKAVHVQSSNTNYQSSGNVLFNTDNAPAHDIEYHPTAQKSFIIYRKQSTTTVKLKTLTNSGTYGTTVALGSEVDVHDNSLGYIYQINAKYNAGLDAIVVVARYPQTSNHGYLFTIGWNSGTSSPVIGAELAFYTKANVRDWPLLIPADGTRNFIVHNHRPASTYDIHATVYDGAKVAKGYGVANASVSNGQNVEVISIGSIADNQSSLSIGTKYFYGANGALATSGTVEAGRAISATELLITNLET